VYVAGDTEDTPEMRALKSIDIAFPPMNLPYTMSVQKAAEAIRAFTPKIVYPYHYGRTALTCPAEAARLRTASAPRFLARQPL
jgi:L-ascorbate metabolism protein UlaG (beta-lactamase superfamily)